MIVFDPDKDKANFAKHGVSLGRASDLNILARIVDNRYSEPRFRAYGTIEDVFYCLAYVIRDGKVYAVSLRRAHLREIKRYANR